MTVKAQVFLKDVRDNQPDLLIATLEIKLTEDQRKYLAEHYQSHRHLRTLLLKKFNLRFTTKYTKLQLNRTIEIMHEPLAKPTGIRDPDKVKNVYYRPRDKCYEARITVKKVRLHLYKGSKEGAIQAIEDYKKEHGIR